MTDSSRAQGSRALGSTRVEDGQGAVRLEERYATDAEDLWAALTDPDRLARWLGEVSGELVLGGTFAAHFYASGWEGTGRIEACEPSRRLLVTTTDADDASVTEIEVVLTADGDHTVLVLEERGLPLPQVAAYGAGNELHLRDLGDHVAGRGRRPADGRWQELLPLWKQRAGR